MKLKKIINTNLNFEKGINNYNKIISQKSNTQIKFNGNYQK